MRFRPGRTRDDFLADLRGEAAAAFGPERVEHLQPALEAAANALWRLAEAPLQALEEEPDFISGGGPADEAHHD
jgi:hypothetical protein